MRDGTETNSLTVEKLKLGHWYAFRTPLGTVSYAEWRGSDGDSGRLREEGSRRDETWPRRLLDRCVIAPLHAPFEMIEPIGVDRDERCNQPMPWRDVTVLSALFAIACVVWAAIFWFALGR